MLYSSYPRIKKMKASLTYVTLSSGHVDTSDTKSTETDTTIKGNVGRGVHFYTRE